MNTAIRHLFLISGDPGTLAEALAFVDGFDFSGDDNNMDASSGNSDSGVGRFVESHKCRRSDVKVADTHAKAKSRRKNAVYSARLRAKKKNEMQTLKDQVEQLQMQLDRLKSAHTLPTSVLTGADSTLALTSGSCRTGTSSWLKEATAQAYQRQQAEQLNAQLKTLLAKVVKRSRTMQIALQNLQSLGCEINVAVGAPSTILAGPSLRSNDATSQLGELCEFLDQMYASAHDVFATSGVGAVDSTSLVSQIKRDPVSGRRFVQLSSVTPLTSDLDTASRMICSIAKSFFLTLSDDSTSCTLHGAAFVRKFEERDRILYIWTTAMVPSRKEIEGKNSSSKLWLLRVREKGWVMLSRSAKSPDHESMLYTCYEVSSELDTKQRDADCATTEADYNYDHDRIGNGVVKFLSSDLRKFHERIQGKLLAGTTVTAAC
ncbi:hypothetical protein PI124_g9325 [Phytophthora idaei]|nr:hypothetical protein PI125_g8998 [Phytophthora idaei]KAG3157957.1 hypothetical protein PI126_g8057 [Phytophthora idaei]KAG3245928.1 hypothetical protein PI124_g9325 [Phytophthora idaei]